MQFWCSSDGFRSCDVKNVILGKTTITHSFVTLKSIVKYEVILDILFKGLIHTVILATTKMG